MSDDFQGTPPAPEMPAPPASPAPPAASGGGAPSDTGKLLAAFGYIFWPVALIAILIDPYKDEKFVRLHAIQALALAVGGIVLGIVANIPVIGWIVGMVAGLAIFVFAIMGLIKALQSEYWEMPLV
jgi:uncharacterized membrane protein